MPPIEFLPLGLAGRPEAKAVNNERMVVFLFTLLVGPVIGTHARFDESLIALACVARQGLSHRAEGHKPQTGGDLTGSAAFVLPGVVVAHKAEARVARIVFGDELWIARKIAYRSKLEAVHVIPPLVDAGAREGEEVYARRCRLESRLAVCSCRNAVERPSDAAPPQKVVYRRHWHDGSGAST